MVGLVEQEVIAVSTIAMWVEHAFRGDALDIYSARQLQDRRRAGGWCSGMVWLLLQCQGFVWNGAWGWGRLGLLPDARVACWALMGATKLDGLGMHPLRGLSEARKAWLLAAAQKWSTADAGVHRLKTVGDG